MKLHNAAAGVTLTPTYPIHKVEREKVSTSGESAPQEVKKIIYYSANFKEVHTLSATGIESDIIIFEPPAQEVELIWQLDLPEWLEPRFDANGNLCLYAPDRLWQ